MASRHISNTLSRWHKVVDRIKQATQKLASQINGGLDVVTYSNLAVFNAERAGLEADTNAALSKVPLLMQLTATLGLIREALAKANVEKGVSALLAEQVCKHNQKVLYESLLENTSGARLQLADAASVLSTVQHGTPHYRENHAFMRVPAETIAAWEAEVERLGRELTTLTDKISDVNATRLAIELDEEVLTHLGM